ncbi:MAG: hypothetical protein HQL26_05550 [Candidatus Omnitrophica bacterium]|nr:hypothetical protein [Candidatus Omnitrophota bacterium]
MAYLIQKFWHKGIFLGLFLSLFFVLFFLSTARAEWLLNGKPVLNSTFAKTDGAFGAKLEFTDKPNELFAAWNKKIRGTRT